LSTSILKYAYIGARIRGKKASLLTRQDYAKLLVGNIESLYKLLQETPYGDEISKVSPSDFNSSTFEIAAKKIFLETVEDILDDSPPSQKEIISQVLKKFEASNIKTLLRSKFVKMATEEALRYIAPVGTFDSGRCKSLYEAAETVEDLVGLLSDSEYGKILADSMGERVRWGGTLPLESALDKYAYGNLWSSVNQLKGVAKRIAIELFGNEIDISNLKTIARCVSLGLSGPDTMRYIIPIYFNLSEKIVEESASSTDVEEGLEKLAVGPYRDVITSSLREFRSSRSLATLEISLDRFLLGLNEKLLLRYPSSFHLGLALVFLNLKWNELRNLRTLIKGVEEGLPSDRIQAFLIV
jgi:ATP synthase A1 C subunit